MITRIRIVGIQDGKLDEYRLVARDWQHLLHKHGGKVLGFYVDDKCSQVTGIAEYWSREHLAEVQRKCESDDAFPDIMKRARGLITSFEEQILNKIELED